MSNEIKGKVYVLRPLPELEFLDPVTGKIPKNVDKLIQAKMDSAKKNTDDCLKKPNASGSIDVDSKFKLQRMPEMSLLDPVTGKLPRNYKQILAERTAPNFLADKTSNLAKRISNLQRENSSSASEENKSRKDNKRRSKSLNFKISKIDINPTRNIVPNLSGHTNQHVTKSIGVRKALFNTEVPRTSSLMRRSSQKRSKEVDDTIPLIDIEESEKELINQKKKPRFVLPKSRQISPRQTLNARRRTLQSPSVLSLDEFVKLEQQLKTPKGAKKGKQHTEFNLQETITMIMKKIDKNKELYETINKSDIEINNKLNNIMRYLEQSQNIPEITTTSIPNLENDIGNIENISPNKRATNLRVTTLKKNLEKKVLFDIDENASPLGIRTTRSVSKISILQTPNTSARIISKKAEEQYLNLQDTPKIKSNGPFI